MDMIIGFVIGFACSTVCYIVAVSFIMKKLLGNLLKSVNPFGNLFEGLGNHNDGMHSPPPSKGGEER